MLYRIALLPMTLSDVEGYFSYFKYLYIQHLVKYMFVVFYG